MHGLEDVEAIGSRDIGDTCPHGMASGCVRCAFEELERNPGKEYVPLRQEDINCVVLTMPEIVTTIIRQNPELVLAGGFLRSLVGREPIADLDLFMSGDPVKNDKLAIKATAMLSGHYPMPFSTSRNATTVPAKVVAEGYPIQIIFKRPFANPHELLNGFDFTICKAAVWYDPAEKKWCGSCHKDFYSDVASKRLMYQPGVNRPVVERDALTIGRMFKYIDRGYSINRQELAHIVTDAFMNITSDRTDRDAVYNEVDILLQRRDDSTTQTLEYRSKPYIAPKPQPVRPKNPIDWGS